jgi:hypothetical protein
LGIIGNENVGIKVVFLSGLGGGGHRVAGVFLGRACIAIGGFRVAQRSEIKVESCGLLGLKKVLNRAEKKHLSIT